MYRMKAILFLPFVVIVGCGGLTGTGGDLKFNVLPRVTEVAQGASREFEAKARAGVSSVVWSIQEGSAGGTLSPHTGLGRFYATYTAPNTPGTYHVLAEITDSNSETETVTAIVTVP